MPQKASLVHGAGQFCIEAINLPISEGVLRITIPLIEIKVVLSNQKIWFFFAQDQHHTNNIYSKI